MKKNVSILLFCLLLIGHISGQQKIIFSDQFDNNNNHWSLGKNDNFQLAISDGKLHIQKFNKNFTKRCCLWLKQAIPLFDASKDFIIEFSAKVLAYEDIVDVIDIQWGSLDTCQNCEEVKTLYQVSLNPNYVRLEYFKKGELLSYFNRSKFNGEIIALKDKPIVERVEKATIEEKFNTYKIVQKDGLVTVSINANKVSYFKINPIKGGFIGIQQCLKTSWEMDWITISQ